MSMAITQLRWHAYISAHIQQVPLYKIHANNHNPAYSVEAEINGSPLPIRFEIDTGSAFTIITRSDFDKLGLPLAALSKPTVKLIGFAGKQIQCPVERKMSVTINGKTHDLMLTVVDTRGPSLLGRDGLACFKLDCKLTGESSREEMLDEAQVLFVEEETTGPWQRLHIDFAGPFLGQTFLIVVDAYSKYLDVIPMSTATSSGTNKALRRLFATFGSPLHIVSDTGSQFTSFEFEDFLRKNGIAHTCSVPGHPETNGLAESYVGHFKTKMKLMDMRDDNDTRAQRFLFTDRTTPISNGKSPAELLMNRQPRSGYDGLKRSNNSEVKSFEDNAHLTPEFKPGDAVFTLSFRRADCTWVPGVILSALSPVNYQVQVEDVVWKRHRNHLVRGPSPKFRH